MNRYQNNSFRILGLKTDATMQDIISRVNEIKVKKSIGAEISYDYDFSWLGPLDRSDENVNSALQRLENPLSRIKEEMFWFWSSEDVDVQALRQLSQGKRQAAHDLWKQNVSEYEPASTKKITSYFNQTILAHSSALATEIDMKGSEKPLVQKVIVEKSSSLHCPKCNKEYDDSWTVCLNCDAELVRSKSKTIVNRELSTDPHWKNWAFLIEKFRHLHLLADFWSVIADRAKKLNDPRLSSRKLDEIKDGFLEEIASVNYKCISRALVLKDLERALQHVTLLKTLNLNKDYIKSSINNVLASHIESINSHCMALEKDAAKLVNETSSGPLTKRYEDFLQVAQPLIVEADIVDDELISDYALSRDLVAVALRDVSIKLHNKYDEFEKSHQVMQKGIEFVTSDYKKDQFRKDETLLKSHVEEAKSLNYEDKIGSKRISVSKEKIIFGNQTLLTKDIQAIRYGIYVHSTNGIQDHQSYKIWLWNGKSTTEIECASGLGAWSKQAETKYHGILGSLYQTVQVPLINKMINDFEANGSVTLGGVVIDYTGWHRSFSYDPISKGMISLTSKIFKTKDADTKEDQKKNLSWTDYGGYNSANGKIFVFRVENKKNELWTSYTLRDDWNAVNLKLFLDYLHKDGKLWRIINTKPFEKKKTEPIADVPPSAEKKQVNQVAAAPIPSTSGQFNLSFLKRIPWWVWLVGGVWLFSSLSGSGGSSNTSSSTSQSYKYSSAALTARKNKITNLKSEIDQKEKTLLSMRSEAEADEKQLAEYQNSIKQTESTYTSETIPTNAKLDYDLTISTHNTLLEKYNQLIATHNQLNDSYKEDIKTYNNLVDEYNQRAHDG